MFKVTLNVSPNGYGTACLASTDIESLPKAIRESTHDRFRGLGQCLVRIGYVIDSPSIIHITQLYNEVQMFVREFPHLVDNSFIALFKGSGKAFLCWTLGYLLKHNYIHKHATVALEASRELEDDDMPYEKLIQYYKALGFHEVTEDDGNSDIEMEATLESILARCEEGTDSHVGRFLKQKYTSKMDVLFYKK